MFNNLREFSLALIFACHPPGCCSALFLLAGDRRRFPQPQTRLGRALACPQTLRVRTLGDGTAVAPLLPTLWNTWSASIVGPHSDHQRVHAYCVHSRNFLSAREVKSSQERASRPFGDRAGTELRPVTSVRGSLVLPAGSFTEGTLVAGFCSRGFSHSHR